MLYEVFVLYFGYVVTLTKGVPWQNLKCHVDNYTAPESDGIISEMGRFPWLGIIQHNFNAAGKTRFAVTTGFLIHPGWVLAAAEDIAKLPLESLANSTKFIVWRTPGVKLVLDVFDYILHPEFTEKTTFATIALVQLDLWSSVKRIAPVSPVCMPTRGGGVFDKLFVLKMTDERTEMEKHITSVDYVTDDECREFYVRSQLNYKKMVPTYQICTVFKTETKPCVADAGTALITKQNFGYWTLLGFGVRGPSCGAPARFVNIYRYLQWIDDSIMNKPINDGDSIAFALRQLSPQKLIMVPGDVTSENELGQCEKKGRGGVLFKDSSELITNKSFGQGYYYAEVWQIAQFTCAKLSIVCNARTNAGVWLEHHCHPDLTAQMLGTKTIEERRRECFYYFKSSAHMEFRFFFSFRAVIELNLYGTEDLPRWIPSPWTFSGTTDKWWPTDEILRMGSFSPYFLSFWHL